jgi:hypothetical protein
MKRMILLMMILIFFSLPCSTLIEMRPTISIKLQPHGDTFILGEHPGCDVILENESIGLVALDPRFHIDIGAYFKISGKRKQECIIAPEKAEYTRDYWILMANGIKMFGVDISRFGVAKEGNYEVWLVYNPAIGALKHFAGPTDLIRTKVESNHIKFKIIKPKGVDLEVFNKYHDDCGHITLGPKALLQKYPTSTYAGNVLVDFPIELASQPASCLDDPDKFMHSWFDKGGGEEAIQRRIREEKDSMLKYIVYAKAFLEAHPDFYWSRKIRIKYAMCLGFTGKVNEAKEQLKYMSKGSCVM